MLSGGELLFKLYLSEAFEMLRSDCLYIFNKSNETITSQFRNLILVIVLAIDICNFRSQSIGICNVCAMSFNARVYLGAFLTVFCYSVNSKRILHGKQKYSIFLLTWFEFRLARSCSTSTYSVNCIVYPSSPLSSRYFAL